MNIGQNTVVNGAFVALANVCDTTNKYCLGTGGTSMKAVKTCATTNTARCDGTTGVNYDFNGYTKLGHGQATQPPGTDVTTSSYSAVGLGNPLPLPSLSDVTCPTGFGGYGSWDQTNGEFVHYLWATASGVIPPSAEPSGFVVSNMNNNHCLRVSVAGITPPPDAIGWIPTDGTSTMGEQIYPPDQQFVLCDPGVPADTNNFVPNLQHGTLCGLGVDAFIVKEIPALNSSSGQTIEPWMNTSETLISAVATPAQSIASGGRYFCRIENTEIELGRKLNALEPNALAFFNNSCQEQSGLFGVQVDDAGQGDYYCLGNACQNSGGGDVHDAGQNTDYKQAWRFENNPAFRGIYGGTDSGPTTGTQWLSRNCVHYLGTDWSGATGQGGTMFPAQGGEGCLTTFEIDNASGVTIFAPYSSGQSVRSANNVVEFGHYSWFNTVIGSQPGTASCPIMDWAQYNFSQSCTTPTRPSAGVTGIQPITGAYSQENSFEVLTDDVTNIGGTAPAAATTLFSWLIPGSGIGDYTYHCAFTFSVDTSPSKLGIAIQGNLNNTNPPRMQGRALVDTTTTAIASGNSGDITGTTSPTTVIEGQVPTGGVRLGGTLDGGLQVGSGGTQFNIMFYSPTSGAKVNIYANSECEIHGK